MTYSRTAANGFSTIYLTGGTMYGMTITEDEFYDERTD